MFTDPRAKTFLTHVIAISLWPKNPSCTFNLEEDLVRPIPLCNVVDVGEGNVRRFATRARQVLAGRLRLHTIIVPCPGPASIVEMANSVGITLTDSFSAPNTRLLHLPPH
jgi:hypothetical protein